MWKNTCRQVPVTGATECKPLRQPRQNRVPDHKAACPIFQIPPGSWPHESFWRGWPTWQLIAKLTFLAVACKVRLDQSPVSRICQRSASPTAKSGNRKVADHGHDDTFGLQKRKKVCIVKAPSRPPTPNVGELVTSTDTPSEIGGWPILAGRKPSCTVCWHSSHDAKNDTPAANSNHPTGGQISLAVARVIC